jgi:hypothetical protein
MLHSAFGHTRASHNTNHFGTNRHHRHGICPKIPPHRSHSHPSQARTKNRRNHRHSLRNSKRYPLCRPALLLDASTRSAAQASRGRPEERLHPSHSGNGRAPRHYPSCRARQPTEPTGDTSHRLYTAKRQLAYGDHFAASGLRPWIWCETRTRKNDDSPRAAREHIHLRAPSRIRSRDK